jgi:Uma2 family endonuclease
VRVGSRSVSTDLHRFAMSISASPITFQQLAALPDKGQRYELDQGELRMMSPAGNVYNRIAAQLTARCWQHVKENELGEVYAAETGFLISRKPDTVRAPDVA